MHFPGGMETPDTPDSSYTSKGWSNGSLFFCFLFFFFGENGAYTVGVGLTFHYAITL
jgi:hypothetical protein